MAVNWKTRGYTKEQFTEAWLSSSSISDVGRKLGRNMSGSGYYTLKQAAYELGLTDEHMTGSNWWTTETRPVFKGANLEDILVENSTYTNTHILKKRLWKSGILPRMCQECGIEEWCGKPAPLALDHINGIRSDNRIENLRILCYNCHGLTDTFAGKNRGRVTGIWHT